MCHKKTTIFACNCLLRNHRLCSHSQNIIASSIPSHDMEGGSESDSESDFDDSTTVNDHVNGHNNANTTGERNNNKNNINATSQNSTAPTITLQVHSPPVSPSEGTATPLGLNAGASPFAPTPSPFGPTTSSVGPSAVTSTIYSPLNVDTPSRSATNSPSFFYTPASHTGNSSATGLSSTTPSHIFFGNILTPIAPTSNLTLPIFGHAASTSTPATANMHQNQNTNSNYPFTFAAPQATNGTLTPVPSAYMFNHLSQARQNVNDSNPEELIKYTLAETRSPSTRDPLPSGFYPRHFDSAQRHIHWNEVKTEWVDCAAFYCTHFMDLPNMSTKEKEPVHNDCPEYFGDADKVVLVLDLCKECKGYHYEKALREQGGTAEWGMAMAVVNGRGHSGGMGQTQQSQTQHQSQQQGMHTSMGSQQHNRGHTHTDTQSQTTSQPQVVGQHDHEEATDDAKWDASPAFEAIEKLEARYNLLGWTLLRQRIREGGQTISVSGHTPVTQTLSSQTQTPSTQAVQSQISTQTPTPTLTQAQQTRTPPTYVQVTQGQPDMLMLVGVPGAWPRLQQQQQEEDESDEDDGDEQDEREGEDGDDGKITPTTDVMVDSHGYSMVDRFLRRIGLPTY